MEQPGSTHNDLIQREFTRQAEAYASNPKIVDAEWAARLVASVRPGADARVLDIATGPGYVALAFATVTDQVVGVDLTDAPLAIARKNAAERGQENVSFESADANALPWPEDSFDVVVCRLAFHHFGSPAQIFSEMVRVCRPGGRVAVEDLTASEQPDRAGVYNHWERLRDPSHVAALSLGQLLALYRDADVELERLNWEERVQDAEQWMRNTETGPDTAETIRRLILDDASGGLSGTPIFEDDGGRLCFVHRIVTLVGRKTAGLPARDGTETM